MAEVNFTLDGDVGEIVLADPPLNLFGLELARSLMEAATQARDSDARAILVRAEGDNFSAGANVEMFLDRDEAAARELIDEFIPVIRRFAEIPVPTVAAVQGLCLAAGLEVALSCDLIWAAEGSNLGLVEAVIGATPFGGGTQRLVARAGAGRAAEAVLTGTGVSGRDDARLGCREPRRAGRRSCSRRRARSRIAWPPARPLRTRPRSG